MPMDGKLTAEQIANIRWISRARRGTLDRNHANPRPDFDVRLAQEMTITQAPQLLGVSEARAIPVAGVSGFESIDRFLEKTRRDKGLKPAPRISHPLLRRAYMDLIGLPPTPGETAEYLADSSPQAWEHLIDKLLASPHYGERWGRHWLDVARYADSNGFEHDYDRPNAWRYRDYVIRSFNQDTPYNTFLAEQIAGDELTGSPTTV
jgi:hypothetical protein